MLLLLCFYSPAMSTILDFIVVGGGYAATSAALTLGRAKHSALLVHSGPTRNAAAQHGNGFIAHDGDHPGELLKKAFSQLKKYEKTLKLHEGLVTKLVKANADGESPLFTATLDDGSEVTSKRVILATGVKDTLPTLKGLQEIWGKRAHICPYCDAFEYKSYGIIATETPMAEHLANMLRMQWSDNVVLFASPEWLAGNEKTPAPTLLPELKVLSAPSEVRWSGKEEDEVEVLDAEGKTLASVHSVFIPTTWTPQSQLAKDLGAELHPMGFVTVDTEYLTTIPGLAAVGDLAWPRGAKMPTNRVAEAAGSGSRAAAFLSGFLITDNVNAKTGKVAAH